MSRWMQTQPPPLLAGLLWASSTLAADPWIERPLRLPPLGVSADVGLGIGQATSVYPAPDYDTPVGTQKPGAGFNVDGSLGLPYWLAVGVRMGIRFGPNGALTNSDAYGRLYDPLPFHVDPGTGSFANPEFRIQETFVETRVVDVGLDVRFTPRNYSILMPGVPLRFRVPRLLRIDSGVYFPIAFRDFFANPATWGLEIPLAAWFQHDKLFGGPVSGIFWNNPVIGPESTAGVPSELDIHLGVGIGYTLERNWDLKAQVLTTRINHADWAKYIGAGIGVGVVVP